MARALRARGWAAVLLVALVFFRPISRIAPFASLVFLGVQTQPRSLRAAASLTPRSACGGSSHLPPSTSFLRHETSSTSCSTSFSQMCSTTSFSRIAPRSIGSSAGFQYFADHAGSFPTTSFSMPAMLAGQEYRNQKPAPEFVREAFKQSSVFEKVSKAGYDVDATVDRADRFIRAVAGPRSGAELEGRAFPDPKAVRQPRRLPRGLRASTARVVALPPRAAHGEGLQHRASRYVLPAHLDGSDRIAGAGAAARGQQLGGVPRAVHRPDDRRRAIAPFTSCCTSACRTAPSSSIANAASSASRRCRGRATPSNRGAPSSSSRRCSIARARSASTTAASSSCLPITAPISSPPGSAAGAKASRSFPGRPPCGCPAIASTAKAVMLIKPPNRTGPDHDLGRADLSRRSAFDDPRHPRPPGRFAGWTDVRARSPSTPHAAVRHVQPAPEWRFPKAYLDRLDVLTIDGRVLDAAAWNVQRLIWRPDLRLDSREVDLGPRTGNSYLGPGWSLERRETAGDSQRDHLRAGADQLAPSSPRRCPPARRRACVACVVAGGQRTAIDARRCRWPARRAARTFQARDGYRDIVIAMPAGSVASADQRHHAAFRQRRPRGFRLQTRSADDSLTVTVGHTATPYRGTLQLHGKKRPAHPNRSRALLVTSVAPRLREKSQQIDRRGVVDGVGIATGGRVQNRLAIQKLRAR